LSVFSDDRRKRINGLNDSCPSPSGQDLKLAPLSYFSASLFIYRLFLFLMINRTPNPDKKEINYLKYFFPYIPNAYLFGIPARKWAIRATQSIIGVLCFCIIFIIIILPPLNYIFRNISLIIFSYLCMMFFIFNLPFHLKYFKLKSIRNNPRKKIATIEKSKSWIILSIIFLLLVLLFSIQTFTSPLSIEMITWSLIFFAVIFPILFTIFFLTKIINELKL